MDASQGTPLLTTGSKPRGIFQLAIYNSGNTAAADIAFVVIPATAGTGIDGNGQVAVAGEVSFNYGAVDSNLGAATEIMPLVWGPMATKGAGVGGPTIAIIPPNSMLITTPHTATNGETVTTCISAELC